MSSTRVLIKRNRGLKVREGDVRTEAEVQVTEPWAKGGPWERLQASRSCKGKGLIIS